MPFVAKTDSGRVTPHEVESASVRCVSCGSEMGVKRSHVRSGHIVARHFYHLGDSCGYESEKHLRVKSAMAGIVSEIWPHAEVDIEKTHTSGRVADVIVRFDDFVDPFGHGICIEIQHVHSSKDKNNVTRDYVNDDYTVWWIDTDEFVDGELTFQRGPFVVPSSSFRYSSYKTMKEKHVAKALDDGPLEYNVLAEKIGFSEEWTRYLCWSLSVFGSAVVGSIEAGKEKAHV